MTDKLPEALRNLFVPRPRLIWKEPTDHPPGERATATITGIAQYLQAFQEYKETDHYEGTDSWLQKRDAKKQARKERQEKLLNEDIKLYKPSEDPKVKGDAFKTLFVSRLAYSATEADLEKEFGRFGPIERIRIIEDVTAPPDAPPKKRKRGYAFIVYEREKDMKAAYKEADKTLVKGRRVSVDVERGRTVSGWRPRRFGGGLGGRGYTKGPANQPGGPPIGPGGPPFGGRGGFGGQRGRGGFGGDRPGFRGGFGGPPRGGYGGRGGIGYQSNGYGAPEGAPSGPRGGGRGGYGGGSGRFEDDRRGYGNRGSGSSGANNEPLGRDRGGYRDRDRDGGYERHDDHGSRKRRYDGGDGYEERRHRPRY